MKTFIVAICVFIFLWFFPLQWAANETNHYKMNELNNIVFNHVLQAQMDGYFTPTNISDLKTEISDKLHTNSADIVINVTTTPKYVSQTYDPNELIDYDVEIPMNFLAMAQLFGISASASKGMYKVSGHVQSTVLAP